MADIIEKKVLNIISNYKCGLEKIDADYIHDDEINPEYNFVWQLKMKQFFQELNEVGEGKGIVLHYIKSYNLSYHVHYVRGKDTQLDNQAEKKYLTRLKYFLLLAINTYGTEFVFKNLLPASIVYEKRSKLNPINWLRWFFSNFVWSEMKVRPELDDDQAFSAAITQLKQAGTLIPKQKSLEAGILTPIIHRIAGERERLQSLRVLAAGKRGIEVVAVPNVVNTVAIIPPPPPPPPSLTAGDSRLLPHNQAIGSTEASLNLKVVKLKTPVPKEVAQDPRAALLEAIQQGIKLRTVNKVENEQEQLASGTNFLRNALQQLRTHVAPEDDNNSEDKSDHSDDWDDDVPNTQKSTSDRSSLHSSGIGSLKEDNLERNVKNLATFFAGSNIRAANNFVDPGLVSSSVYNKF
jgi:hypothetical protein